MLENHTNCSGQANTLPKEKRPYYTSISVTALAPCGEEDSLKKVLRIIYKSLHKKGSAYFRDMLVPYVPPRAL